MNISLMIHRLKVDLTTSEDDDVYGAGRDQDTFICDEIKSQKMFKSRSLINKVKRR